MNVSLEEKVIFRKEGETFGVSFLKVLPTLHNTYFLRKGPELRIFRWGTEMKLTFFGAAGTVTGSKTFLQHDNKNYLVDCGLYQGVKNNRLKNWQQLPVTCSQLEAVFLTHAHIDHSGLMPLIVKSGLKKRIYCSPSTLKLCRVLLPDSGYLQEEDARYANDKKFSKHHPALPLYTYDDAMRSLEYFSTVPFHQELEVAKDFFLTFRPAGHILGASFLEFRSKRSRLIFSGDLGREDDDVMVPPHISEGADYLVIESTYGNRLHDKTPSAIDSLREIIQSTTERGGNLIIPSFAIGRTQTLVYLIHQLRKKNLINPVPILIDSPMSVQATGLLLKEDFEDCRYPAEVWQEILDGVVCVSDPRESKKIRERQGPYILITASGMLSGGRVLHHVKAGAVDEKNTILLAGFQAPGTRGDTLKSGGKTLKIHGELVPIRCEVRSLDQLSSHADQEGLIRWVKKMKIKPKRIFVNHGEPAAADALRFRFQQELGIETLVPRENDAYLLEGW
jgi:metallo-beta-lactamase family protein